MVGASEWEEWLVGQVSLVGGNVQSKKLFGAIDALLFVCLIEM
jgi:hypothetical protein